MLRWYHNCEVCGEVARQDGDEWLGFQVVTSKSKFHINHSPQDDKDPPGMTICGNPDCALELFERWLDNERETPALYDSDIRPQRTRSGKRRNKPKVES